MKKQAVNPYLPSWEYVPDGEPYVNGDRLYVFGSHDRFNGRNFCQNDYVLWSAPVNDLSDWRMEGTIYRTIQDPDAKKGSFLQAPDVVQGMDGRYYLYYTLCLAPFMSVAVSDKLTGPYEYYGRVRLSNGHVIGSKKHDLFQFDPGVFRDDDGRIWLYSGFGPADNGILGYFARQYIMDGAYVMELGEDMLTVRGEPKRIVPKTGHSAGSGFEGHEFYEASSMRKIRGAYYFIYSSILSHELCYATSRRPDGGFRYGGTLISNGDIGLHGKCIAMNYTGNTHGSLVKVKNQWYVFYHRQTNQRMYSRQGCAEPVTICKDGSIPQAEMTSCGLNGGPLRGEGEYSSHIACNLMGKTGVFEYGRYRSRKWKEHPYFTQTGKDREQDGDQYIANMTDGATAGFKYFDCKRLAKIAVQISGKGYGEMLVRTAPDGLPVCRIPIRVSSQCTWYEDVCHIPDGVHALYFTWSGEHGVNFHALRLTREEP